MGSCAQTRPGRHVPLFAMLVALVAGLAPVGRADVLSVPGDAATIQGAIALAADGDTVLVAPGTYTERLDLLGKQLVILGTGGAANTVVDAQRTGSVVRAASGEPDGARLVGLTLTGGRGQPLGTGSGGGGVFVGASSSVELVDCVITDNEGGVPGGATSHGGGVVVVTSSAKVTLTGCTLSANSADQGAAVAVQGGAGRVFLTDCEVTGNLTSGSPSSKFALYLVPAQGAVDGCVIADNQGGGLRHEESSLLVTRCVFSGNTGWGYQHFAAGGSRVADCEFYGGGLGGARLVGGLLVGSFDLAERCVFAEGATLAINPDGGSSRVESCSFDDAVLDAGALPDALTIHNSILRDSTILTAVAPEVSFSNVQGGAPGVGNVDADPLWADAPARDFALLPGSPSLNTGDPESPLDPDLSPIDMGAVAYHPWTGVGGGVPGALGQSTLTGGGPLTAGSLVRLQLVGGSSDAVNLLVAGVTALGVPFKTGTFWPTPTVIKPINNADPFGNALVVAPWPAGLPSGLELWAQVWFSADTAPAGYGASNGVRGVTP